MKRVVVTGMGALTPVGNNVNEYWQAMLNGTSGASPITRFDAGKFKTRFACELKNFNPSDHLDKAETRRNDLFTQYALIAAEEAVKNAGIDFTTLNRQDRGIPV